MPSYSKPQSRNVFVTSFCQKASHRTQVAGSASSTQRQFEACFDKKIFESLSCFE
jgi:hypothetical protein